LYFNSFETIKNYPKKKSIFYKERDELKRSNFLTQLKEHETDKLVYIDESGIDKFISREYGWGPKGDKVKGEISGRHYSRESFIAGQVQNKIIAPFCYTGTCDSILFNFVSLRQARVT
jgi:hypothetical protein